MLMTPMSVHDRHGGEIISRLPRMEQPIRHHDIETDAAAPALAFAGGMAAYRIALPRRPAP